MVALWTGLKQQHSASDDTKSAQTKKQEIKQQFSIFLLAGI